jgi:hypothetical protein
MMIAALLLEKLTFRQENMEDILTSNVFGSLQYVPPGMGRLWAKRTFGFTSGGDCHGACETRTRGRNRRLGFVRRLSAGIGMVYQSPSAGGGPGAWGPYRYRRW